jgi:prefoldin subunit 5
MADKMGEVEALRAQLEVSRAQSWAFIAESKELCAEVAQLRRALETIEGLCHAAVAASRARVDRWER